MRPFAPRAANVATASLLAEGRPDPSRPAHVCAVVGADTRSVVQQRIEAAPPNLDLGVHDAGWNGRYRRAGEVGLEAGAMGYEIEIELRAAAGPSEFAVRVLRAAAGGEPSTLVQLDLERLLAGRSDLERAVMLSTVAARKLVPVEEAQLRAIGRELFDTVFQGPINGAYRASMMVAQQHNQRLRIVLRLNAPGLAALPWEALWDGEVESYTCLYEPLVRHVPAPYRLEPLDVVAPLRVLGLVASPRGLPELDVQREQEYLSAALARPVEDGLIELHWVQEATWESVHDELLNGRWHVVHFIGHGDYDVDTDQGRLAFVGPDGRKDMVEADRLAALLGEAEPAPRLAVLNSCSSGEEGTRDLFSGTAAALVRSGISAVAAMQFTISDLAALRFARGFYTALGRGRDITAALRAGRIEILGTRRSLEWVTPVLYLRGDNPRLFDLHVPDHSRKGPEISLSDRYERARAFELANRLVNAVHEYDEILRLDPTYKDSADRRDVLGEALGLRGQSPRDESSSSVANIQNNNVTLEPPDAPTDAARPPPGGLSQRNSVNAPAPEEILRLNLDEQYAGRLYGFSPDGSYFAISTPMGVRLIDVGRRQEIGRIPRRKHLFTLGFAFSPDGSRFAAAVSANIGVLWNVVNGKEIARLRLKANVHAFTFSPDGGLLAAASGSYDGNATAHAYLWDASDGHEVSRLRHRGTVFQATFSPDGNRLATASHDKTAALWDVSTLGKIASLQHQGAVFSVDFSSDGSRLVTSTSFTDRLWDAANHHELLRVKVKRGWHISTLSPDSKRLVNLSEHEGGRLSDMSDGGLIRRLSHRGAHQTAFSPDGSRFVTTGGGRSIMWDSETGHEVRRLEREAKLLEAGTRATWFAAQSKDGILQVWNETDGHELGQLRHDGSATLLDIAPDANCVAVEEIVDGKPRLRLWRVTSDGSQS